MKGIRTENPFRNALLFGGRFFGRTDERDRIVCSPHQVDRCGGRGLAIPQYTLQKACIGVFVSASIIFGLIMLRTHPGSYSSPILFAAGIGLPIISTWLRRSRPDSPAAAIAILVTSGAVIIVLSYLGGGLMSSGIWWWLAVVPTAGLLVGKCALWTTAATAALVISAFAVLHHIGYPWPDTYSTVQTPLWHAVSVTTIVVVIAWLVRHFVNAVERQHHKVVLHRRRQKRMNEYLTTFEARERHRIADNLHGYLCQTLAAMAMKIDQVAFRAADELEVRRGCADMEALVLDAVRETRQLLLELSPPGLHENGLEVAARELAEGYAENFVHGCFVESSWSGPPMPRDTCTTAFFVLRECLRNAARHAQATRVDVRLRATADGLHMEIEDDGIGLPSDGDVKIDVAGGFGLVSIKERVSWHNGTVSVDSRHGSSGTIVRVWLPSE